MRELQEAVALHKLMRKPRTIRLKRVRSAILVVHVGIGIDERAVHLDILSEGPGVEVSVTWCACNTGG